MEKDKSNQLNFKYISMDTKDIAISKYNEGFAELANKEEEESKPNVLAVVFALSVITIAFWTIVAIALWVF